MEKKSEQGSREFEQSAHGKSTGLLQEFFEFLQHSKKWWILPIVIVLLALAAFAVLGSTAAAPFIYTLF